MSDRTPRNPDTAAPLPPRRRPRLFRVVRWVWRLAVLFVALHLVLIAIAQFWWKAFPHVDYVIDTKEPIILSLHSNNRWTLSTINVKTEDPEAWNTPRGLSLRWTDAGWHWPWFDLLTWGKQGQNTNFAGVQTSYFRGPSRATTLDGTPTTYVETSFSLHFNLVHELALLLLLWPLLRVAARRHAIGCCLRCGYDLSASPDRCPECVLAA